LTVGVFTNKRACGTFLKNFLLEAKADWDWKTGVDHSEKQQVAAS